MPIYEYQCEKCAHEFEREQRITDDPVKTCPQCRGRKVKKLISQTSFVLKGSGWYSDLYSSSKKEEKKSSDKGGSAETSESSSDKSKKSDKTDKDSSKSKTSAKSDDKKKGGKKNAA